MSRRCAHPGCHGLASSTLCYDYRGRSVWLESLVAEKHPMSHDLCEHHAETLSAPRGWQLEDRRSVTVLDLFDRSAAG